MVTVNPVDNNLLSKCASEQLGSALLGSQGIKIPRYSLGVLTDNSVFEGESHMSSEEQSLLDSLLLAQWEERMWKGHFQYDVTASEIKIIRGGRKFLGQLSDSSTHGSQEPGKNKICHQENVPTFDWKKHSGELLFCITNSDKAESELIPSTILPDGAFLAISNVNPIEYGHIFLVPHGFNSLYHAKDVRMSRTLEMVARVAVEINNDSFHMFYDCPGPTSSHLYFQACYFPDLLPVEYTPLELLFGNGHGGISISTVIDYPIKALLFESNCNFQILVGVLTETFRFLRDKGIPYNLMICDRGQKIFLFLQVQTLSTYSLSAWECAGYFLFRSRQEFDQVTEADLFKCLSSVSLDDEGFLAVKHICCSIASKIST